MSPKLSLTLNPKLAVAAVVAGLALTACSSTASHAHATGSATPSTAATAGSGSPSTAATASEPPPTASPSTAPAPSDTATGGGGGGSTVAAAGQQCTTDQLSVAQTNLGVGAGQLDFTITFTNNADQPCTMTGYPGVSYEALPGKPTGAPAARSGATYHTVTLAAHGTAGATFHDANGLSGYDPGTCKLTDATGLKVYPPGEKSALFLPWKTQHCTGTGVHAPLVGPVTQG